MDLIEIMARRRSIRKFKGEHIPEEKKEKILQAALLAPSSRGKAPLEFYVVKDRGRLEDLSKAKAHGASLLAGCDAAIVVFADGEISDAWIEDSSIALAHMELAATEQEVGSCWIQIRMRKDDKGGDAEDNVREIMGLSDPYRLVGIMALGIADEEKEPYRLDELKWEKVHRDL